MLIYDIWWCHKVTGIEPRLMMRHFRSGVFCGREELLLLWTLTFSTFKGFYIHRDMYKTKKGNILKKLNRPPLTERRAKSLFYPTCFNVSALRLSIWSVKVSLRYAVTNRWFRQSPSAYFLIMLFSKQLLRRASIWTVLTMTVQTSWCLGRIIFTKFTIFVC